MNARHRMATAIISRWAVDTQAMEDKVLEQMKLKRRTAMDEVIGDARLIVEQARDLPEEVKKLADLLGKVEEGTSSDDDRTALSELAGHVVDMLAEIQSQATAAIVALCVVVSLVRGEKLEEGEENARSGS